jgi:ABC-2 type transport system permease protein
VNIRGVRALTRANLQGWMAARSFFWLLAFGWMIPPLIYLLVWSTAAGEGQLGGLERDTVIVYYLVLIVVNQFTYSVANWTVGDLIREGLLNPLLLRPLHPFWDAMANDLAGKAVFLSFIVPVTAVLGLVLQPRVAIDSTELLLFVPALVMAWLLRFLWGYWIALLAFWSTRADALLALQDAFIFLLAGHVAPLALLPPALQTAARWLPFRYMVGFPVEVLTGQLSPSATGQGLLVQAAWLAAAAGLCTIAWRAGVRRYAAIGG